VILLCEHDHEGSYGFILNKYVDLTLPDILEDMPALDNRISLGGPVQSSNLYYIHTLGSLIEGSTEIADGIFVGGDFEQVQSLVRTGVLKEHQIRFFVGYSGWSENQLDSELNEHSWYVCDAQNIPIMDTERDDIWGLALKEMGGDFANLAHFPSDPNLN
jgi:putative transcriptional regulator